MAAGLPVVATRVGGNARSIDHGRTGLLVTLRDAAAMAEGILAVLADPRLASALARAGQEYVSAHYSFESLLSRVDDLYSELLPAPSRH